MAGALRRTDEAARFAGLRRWAAAAGLPRLGFVRVETAERSKPFFVDLASPLSARVLRRALGRADPGTVIRWTEMLPEPDGLWLADAEGRRYTSELRLVAVDDRAARTAAGRPAAAPAGGGGAQR